LPILQRLRYSSLPVIISSLTSHLPVKNNCSHEQWHLGETWLLLYPLLFYLNLSMCNMTHTYTTVICFLCLLDNHSFLLYNEFDHTYSLKFIYSFSYIVKYTICICILSAIPIHQTQCIPLYNSLISSHFSTFYLLSWYCFSTCQWTFLKKYSLTRKYKRSGLNDVCMTVLRVRSISFEPYKCQVW